jgi:hypothetical protein
MNQSTKNKNAAENEMSAQPSRTFRQMLLCTTTILSTSTSTATELQQSYEWVCMMCLAQAQCCKKGESDWVFICVEGRTHKIQMIDRERMFGDITFPMWSVAA